MHAPRRRSVARLAAPLLLAALALAPAAGAHPLVSPSPISNVLAPGTSSVAFTVSSAVPTSVAYAIGLDRPFAQMTPFAQGAGTAVHHTPLAIDPDPRVVTTVYVRCAAQPESVLVMRWRARANANPGYPRIGNLWGWGKWKYEEGRSLADRARVDLWLGADLWDLAQLPDVANDFFQLRTLNPNALFLLSMNAVEPYTNAIPESYFLHDVNGHRIEVWPGSYRLNLTRNEVADFQADWAYAKLAEAGFIHDGVFVDNVFLSQSWQDTDIYGNPVQIDADGNGLPDDPAVFDAAWRAGVLREVEAIRARSPDILMSGHAMDVTEPRLLAVFNGISVGFSPANVIEHEESYPAVEGTYATWSTAARAPRLNMQEGSPIDLFAYGYDYDPLTKAKPASAAFARDFGPWMRFAFGLTLMRDGYTAYEWGDTDHGQTWWYDEYDFDLGVPQGAAQHVGGVVEPGPNAIVNPGFESAIVEPWGLWTGAGYAASDTRDAAVAHAGAASARVDVTAAPGEAWQVEFRQDARTLEAGVAYELTFWAKASSPRTMQVTSLRNAPDWEPFGLQANVPVGADWAPHTLPFVATRGGSDARVQFLLGAATGSVWIDDVSLTRRAPDLMRRDFERGIVLLNATDAPQTIALGPGFRRLAGARTPLVQAIVDDSVAAFTTPAGAWTRRAVDSGEWKAAGPFFHSFGDSLHWLASGPGEARWPVSVPVAGTYTVSAWWPNATDSATWAPDTRWDLLVNGAVVGGSTWSQRSGGDAWHGVATATLAPGQDVQVRLTCPSGRCGADAVYVESAARWNDGSAANAVTLAAHDAIVLRRDASAGVEPPAANALRFAAPAPNPARSRVSFAFDLPSRGPVTLRVYDVSGRRVAEPLRAVRAAGPATAAWDLRTRAGRAVPPGVYVAELRAGGRVATQRFSVAP